MFLKLTSIYNLLNSKNKKYLILFILHSLRIILHTLIFKLTFQISFIILFVKFKNEFISKINLKIYFHGLIAKN